MIESDDCDALPSHISCEHSPQWLYESKLFIANGSSLGQLLTSLLE